MKKPKIIREFVNLEEQTVLNVDTLETRTMTVEEQEKYNNLIEK
jgi:hypothetical protein